MSKVLRLASIGLLIIALALVRFYENDLFSDPLLSFFKTKFNTSSAPDLNTLQLIATTSWRYVLNSMISIGIIGLAFPAKRTIAFSLAFYALAYLVLILLFWYFISDFSEEHYLTVFYIRRFLIQPIFVLILLPAFYYQKKIQNTK